MKKLWAKIKKRLRLFILVIILIIVSVIAFGMHYIDKIDMFIFPEYSATLYDGNNPLSAYELSNITAIKLKNVYSLDFLQGYDNITHIYVSDNYKNSVCFDISELSSFTNLKEIDLAFSDVTGDISAFSNLTNLIDLNLSYTHVTGDIAELEALKLLEYLSINDTSVYGDIKSLKTMENLEWVGLSKTDITGDIKNLAKSNAIYNITLNATC